MFYASHVTESISVLNAVADITVIYTIIVITAFLFLSFVW
jgi:hypothetical protein